MPPPSMIVLSLMILFIIACTAILIYMRAGYLRIFSSDEAMDLFLTRSYRELKIKRVIDKRYAKEGVIQDDIVLVERGIIFERVIFSDKWSPEVQTRLEQLLEMKGLN